MSAIRGEDLTDFWRKQAEKGRAVWRRL